MIAHHAAIRQKLFVDFFIAFISYLVEQVFCCPNTCSVLHCRKLKSETITNYTYTT